VKFISRKFPLAAAALDDRAVGRENHSDALVDFLLDRLVVSEITAFCLVPYEVGEGDPRMGNLAGKPW
jgi:hypothetical protein